jgi:hypothetical protein
VRIRAVRPDFWQDEVLGHLSDAVRLFYIGLWCVSDDAGWFEWRPGQLGAALYPYRSAHRRERDIEAWTGALESAGRVVRHPCGCGQVPTMVRHQKLGGSPSYHVRDKHKRHLPPDESVPLRTDKPLEVGKGRVGKEEGGSGGDWDSKITEMRRRGEAS